MQNGIKVHNPAPLLRGLVRGLRYRQLQTVRAKGRQRRTSMAKSRQHRTTSTSDCSWEVLHLNQNGITFNLTRCSNVVDKIAIKDYLIKELVQIQSREDELNIRDVTTSNIPVMVASVVQDRLLSLLNDCNLLVHLLGFVQDMDVL